MGSIRRTSYTLEWLVDIRARKSKSNVTCGAVCQQKPQMFSATASPLAREPSSPDAATHGAATSTAAHRLRALDALLDRNVGELQALYANARTARIGDVRE